MWHDSTAFPCLDAQAFVNRGMQGVRFRPALYLYTDAEAQVEYKLSPLRAPWLLRPFRLKGNTWVFAVFLPWIVARGLLRAVATAHV